MTVRLVKSQGMKQLERREGMLIREVMPSASTKTADIKLIEGHNLSERVLEKEHDIFYIITLGGMEMRMGKESLVAGPGDVLYAGAGTDFELMGTFRAFRIKCLKKRPEK